MQHFHPISRELPYRLWKRHAVRVMMLANTHVAQETRMKFLNSVLPTHSRRDDKVRTLLET